MPGAEGTRRAAAALLPRAAAMVSAAREAWAARVGCTGRGEAEGGGGKGGGSPAAAAAAAYAAEPAANTAAAAAATATVPAPKTAGMALLATG